MKQYLYMQYMHTVNAYIKNYMSTVLTDKQLVFSLKQTYQCGLTNSELLTDTKLNLKKILQ